MNFKLWCSDRIRIQQSFEIWIRIQPSFGIRMQSGFEIRIQPCFENRIRIQTKCLYPDPRRCLCHQGWGHYILSKIKIWWTFRLVEHYSSRRAPVPTPRVTTRGAAAPTLSSTSGWGWSPWASSSPSSGSGTRDSGTPSAKSEGMFS